MKTMHTIERYLFQIVFLTVILLWASCSPKEQLFTQHEVNRCVSDFEYDGIDQSSPLNYYLSRAHLMAEGKAGLMAKISTAKFELDTSAVDEEVDEILRQRILSEKIVKIVAYKDSAAVIITEYADGWLLLNHTWIENGKWVNGGQGLAEDMADAEKQLQERLPVLCSSITRIEEISSLPPDVKSFTEYLQTQSLLPEEFIMQQIATHELVINGEYHRRKVSWDMLQQMLALPDFPKVCGTIFMELPSREQSTMDEFLSAIKPDGELILKIFRNEQIYGWWDKGEYDFICNIWELNRHLPENERIRIRLVDYQIPYSQIQTAEELCSVEKQSEDRNTHMSDVIEQYIKGKTDSRNCLFLVGCGHAYKSGINGFASAGADGVENMTAGNQLAQRLGAGNVFTIFQHAFTRDNGGGHKSAIRGGLFDKAFAENGNRPVGFPLQGSPFGKEPFDGIYELKYKAGTGTYQDNFDGYLFLHSLANEPQNEPLMAVFDEGFIAEMQRRSAYMGWDDRKDIWFGHNVSELTTDIIRQAL